MHRRVFRSLPCLSNAFPLRLVSMTAAVSTPTADGSAADQLGTSARADHVHLTADEQRTTARAAAWLDII